EMFGADALQGWWDKDLSAAQLEASRRRLTAARGLPWWNDLTTLDEQRERDSLLLETIECHELTHECVWEPRRPGFHQLVGVGGWPMSFSDNSRRWGAEQPRLIFCNWRTDQECAGMDGAQAFAANMERFTSDDGNRRWLQGRLRAIGLTLGEVGLEEADGVIRLRAPDDPATDWLYSEAAAGLTGCPWAIDLRVRCGGGSGGGNFTRSEPIGIVVHEIRTVTRPVATRP
ncbi:MAG: hypothetical protein OXC00_07935, partial [Acidimicrobiaceae bacterium]|nr:hypothetical protein [Acidimicrobiaceae bacterium]